VHQSAGCTRNLIGRKEQQTISLDESAIVRLANGANDILSHREVLGQFVRGLLGELWRRSFNDYEHAELGKGSLECQLALMLCQFGEIRFSISVVMAKCPAA
jgi:hypothetical protein